MNGESLFLGAAGLCAGGITAAGIVGLSIGLSIIPRFAGITHTAHRILWYEDATMLGAVVGNLVYLFDWPLPGGAFLLGTAGLFMGIFLGSWILALAEMANIFPILARRIRMRLGMPLAIISVAAGKALGSLWYFFYGW